MIRPKFVKTLRKDDAVISISVGDYDLAIMCEDDETYMDFSKPLSEKQALLAMSQAYKIGYEQAVEDAKEQVRRVLYERKTDHAPKPSISKTEDLREPK